MRGKIISTMILFFLCFVVTACTPEQLRIATISVTETFVPTPSETFPPTDTPIPMPTETLVPTKVPSVTFTPSPTSVPDPRVLAEKGVFEVGLLKREWVDPARSDRLVSAAVYYPAVNTQRSIEEDAAPNQEDGPYPLVIFSAAMGTTRTFWGSLSRHLTSYGMVVISLGQEGDKVESLFVERPLDVKFVLDNLETLLDAEFYNLVDKEHVGLMGYSNGGYTVFNAAGAQIDPAYWEANGFGEDVISTLSSKTVRSAWEDITEFRKKYGNVEDEELWPGIATSDVDAVLGIVPSTLMLFGDRGLSVLEIPTMIIAGEVDVAVRYQDEIAPFFAPLGADEKYLITMLGYDHLLGLDPEALQYVKHYIVAFFGYYLQGNADYRVHLTEESVGLFEDLHWGVYE